MIYQTFCIYDKRLQSYGVPFSLPDLHSCDRAMHRASSNPDNDYCMFAADYVVMRIGTYDGETGKFDLFPTPVVYRDMASFKELQS